MYTDYYVIVVNTMTDDDDDDDDDDGDECGEMTIIVTAARDRCTAVA